MNLNYYYYYVYSRDDGVNGGVYAYDYGDDVSFNGAINDDRDLIYVIHPLIQMIQYENPQFMDVILKL